MFCRKPACSRLLVLASALIALSVSAEGAASRTQDEQAIRAAAKSYLAALARGDSKALAELWVTDGDFIDDQGNAHPVSALLAEAAEAIGQGPQAETNATTSKIRFVTDDVAIEDGVSEVVSPDAKRVPPSRGHFHAVWVKRDGRWRLASLCEMPVATPADPRLSELSWMVGTWTADGDSGEKLEVTVQWNATGTFLLRDMKTIRDGKVVLRGSQRIGWDPLTRELRSWSFDSDGGYGEATWAKDGDSFVGQATAVLPDGRQSSATIVITFDGRKSFTRTALAGRVQGEPKPDREVRFTRKPDSER